MHAAKEIELYRPQLLALLSRLNANRAQLRMEASHHMDDEAAGAHYEPAVEPEDASAARQNVEISLGMLENEDQLYAEVNAALARLEDHSFGCCKSCGHAIPTARLRAIPYASHCIACAHASEGQSERG